MYIDSKFSLVEIEHFFAGIDYFTTGNLKMIRINKLNRIMSLKGKRCLVLSRYEMPAMSNLVLYRCAPTKILLYCLMRIRAIFLPVLGGVYYKGQISGLIHLAASFKCPLLLPLSIYKLQKLESYESIKPFSSEEDLIFKL